MIATKFKDIKCKCWSSLLSMQSMGAFHKNFLKFRFQRVILDTVLTENYNALNAVAVLASYIYLL